MPKYDCDIYIDVDGVLFAAYDGQLQLRPYVNSFLKWCHETFENVYWLTCWHNGFDEVLRKTYGHWRPKYRPWGSGDKTTGIDFTRKFIWIEDGTCKDERAVLEEKGLIRSYIEIPNMDNVDILLTIRREIEERIWEIGGVPIEDQKIL
jgi:hypothetical protein